MKQFEALAALSKDRDQLRHGQAARQLDKGLDLLQKLQADNFNEPLRLQEAAGLLIDALKNNRRDIRPCLGLAYIFLILEDHQMAQKYVRQALEIEPQNAQVRDFQTRIAEDYQRVAARRDNLRLAPSLVSGETAKTHDLDKLYDECEGLIRNLLRELMVQGVAQPVADRRKLGVLEQNLQNYQQAFAHISQQLQVVDREIDCSDLLRLLKPIEAQLNKNKANLALSQHWIQLCQQLQDELTTVEQCLEEATQVSSKADLEILEENLDALLDNADGYAQAIEDYEAQGHHVEPLLGPYEELQKKIETYQDLLEELQESLMAPV